VIRPVTGSTVRRTQSRRQTTLAQSVWRRLPFFMTNQARMLGQTRRDTAGIRPPRYQQRERAPYKCSAMRRYEQEVVDRQQRGAQRLQRQLQQSVRRRLLRLLLLLLRLLRLPPPQHTHSTPRTLPSYKRAAASPLPAPPTTRRVARPAQPLPCHAMPCHAMPCLSRQGWQTELQLQATLQRQAARRQPVGTSGQPFRTPTTADRRREGVGLGRDDE
jgi:hypothetical protein